jgi:hypothetical protein
MGRSRKIHTPPTEEISAVQRGRGDKTMIIVNVLGHPKGVGGLTSNFLCGSIVESTYVTPNILAHQIFLKILAWREHLGNFSWRGVKFSSFCLAWPVLLGKQSKSGNIRSIVGQYWLIIKENGTNCVNFVRNCVNFVENVVICWKFVCFEKFLYVRKNCWPLKWYTDQNFLAGGGLRK